jgi:hypothetical protein
VTSAASRHTDKHDLRPAILGGLVVGAINLAAPVAFWWLDDATVLALSIAFIAAVYIGFAIADGRPKVLVVEVLVASVFVILAAVAITETAWLLVVAFAGHGLKDLWQERTHFVANTRWWPPFCAVVDWVVAIGLIVEIVVGTRFR